MNKLILITVASIFFPIYLDYQGRDAITTGSIAIIICFFCIIVVSLITRNVRFKWLVSFLIIILLALISQLSVQETMWLKSFRHFVSFVTSVMLFFIVTNHYGRLDIRKQKQSIDSLISFLLIMAALQIIVGAILYFYPPFGEALAIFTTRTEDIIETPVAVTKRLQSIMTGWEEFGEFLAVLSPFVFYYILSTKKISLSLSLLALFVVGVILTATRSAIFLFSAAGFVFILWNWSLIRPFKLIVGIYLFSVLTLLVLFLSPTAQGILGSVTARFDTIADTYTKSQSISVAIDRAEVWENAKEIVTSNINLFGNGHVTNINFHNLYLTLIYKFGIIGFIAFIALFIYILIQLCLSLSRAYNPQIKALVTTCILSFSVFLINEIKFEFNRGSSYQQVIWLLLALYWLVPQHISSNNTSFLRLRHEIDRPLDSKS